MKSLRDFGSFTLSAGAKVVAGFRSQNREVAQDCVSCSRFDKMDLRRSDKTWWISDTGDATLRGKFPRGNSERRIVGE